MSPAGVEKKGGAGCALSSNEVREWRTRARAFAANSRWSDALALQRAVVGSADGRFVCLETADRFRLLRWSLALGRWREALEEIDALYARLARRGAGGGTAAGWLFLARGVAQYQLGWGTRFRRSLAAVLRVARRGGSERLLAAALEVAYAYERLRSGNSARTAWLRRRAASRTSGCSRPTFTSWLSTRHEDDGLWLPGVCPGSEPGRAHFSWARLPEFIFVDPDPASLENSAVIASTAIEAWLERVEQDPTRGLPGWGVHPLLGLVNSCLAAADRELRIRIVAALSNATARLAEPHPRAEALALLSDLRLSLSGESDSHAGRAVTRARADLALAAGLFRQLGLESRADDCEERWARLSRLCTEPSVSERGIGMPSAVGLSLETVRRRAASIGIITRDPRLLQELARIALLAESPLPVLVSGESGTGKELVARAIHRWSTRTGECVAIHCGAIPRDLLESELFGYARGAFTGAAGEKAGLVEAADGGTLFLDEIGEMGMDAQMKMLRVLESGEVRRVGDLKVRRVHVRLVAATHRDLDEAVANGRFRLDLLHRIRGVNVRLLPIRERRGDIPILVEHFLEELRRTGPAPRVSERALARLCGHDWPGNVRELRATLLRAAYLARALGEAVLTAEHLGLPGMSETAGVSLPAFLPGDESAGVSSEEVARSGLDAVLEKMERRLILQALEENGWNRTRTAERLGGLSRTTLLSKMKRLGIEGSVSADAG